MWLFTKHGFYSAVCARQGDGSHGQSVDPDRIMVRARVRSHLEALKERLLANGGEQPTSIRFHRACSWIARVEKNGGDDHDTDLLSLWIAFNSLYGHWDEQKREPKPDRECWRGFEDWGPMGYPPLRPVRRDEQKRGLRPTKPR